MDCRSRTRFGNGDPISGPDIVQGDQRRRHEVHTAGERWQAGDLLLLWINICTAHAREPFGSRDVVVAMADVAQLAALKATSAATRI